MTDHPFHAGDVIVEKHPDAQEQRIVYLVRGHYVLVVSLASGRQTDITWQDLSRYRLVAPYEKEGAP